MTQKFDLDFSELERVTPNNLVKVVAEEKAAKKSASKQLKVQKSKKKAASKKPASEYHLNPSLPPERVSIETEPEAENVVLVLDEQSLTMSADTSLIAPKSRMDVV